MARLSLIAAAIAVVVTIALLGVASGLFVDALWFRHLGLMMVFRTVLLAKLACFTLAFAACYAVVAAIGLAAVRHTRGSGLVRVVLRRVGNGGDTVPELIAPFAERLPWRGLVLGASAVIAALVAAVQMGSWQDYLLWLYGGEFGVTDPYFGRDLGFFAFALPTYRALIGAAMAIVIFAGLLAAAVFWLKGTLFRRSGEVIPPAAVSILSLVFALFLLVRAAGYWLGRYELLLESYGAVFGAGCTVARVKMPFQWILVSVATRR